MRGPVIAVVLWVIGLGLVFQASPVHAVLEDILYEKGQLTKEEWIKAKAEREQDEARKVDEDDKKLEQKLPFLTKYDQKKGLRFESRDGNFQLKLGARLQFRYSFPQNGDSLTPASPTSQDDKQVSSFRVRRARLKVGGHAYRPWIKYYFEYDWPSSRLLDWRVDIAKFSWLKLRVGQWKINYNRERVDSSGKQQFVERSIVNAPFTLDRQIGGMFYGDLFKDTHVGGVLPAYLRWWAGAFTGTGINEKTNDDKRMLYMGRLQWNFFGRDLKWTQSDVEYHEKPTGSIAFAAAHNRTDRMVFPSSRAMETVDGQFEINQGMQEFAFKWRGWSVQQEFHLKEVTNRATGVKTKSTGAYVQTGLFPHTLIKQIPAPLEVAYRYAFVNASQGAADTRREHTFAVNWFFGRTDTSNIGHRNKLTVDYSHLTGEGGLKPVDRVRLQWDVSF